MNRITTCIIIVTFLFAGLSYGQQKGGKHFAKPTPLGEGKIDTRIDNMGYWKDMAKKGFVRVTPYIQVPPAKFTSSKMNGRGVLTSDSDDVPVTTLNSTQSENSIFADHNDGRYVLNSNNSTENPVGSLYGANDFMTDDYGSTWDGELTGAGGNNSGDPTTAISLSGRYYVGYIKNSGQGVAWSTDNGANWTNVQVAPAPSSSILDKNHMWIDNSLTSAHEGNLYNAWTTFADANANDIEFSRSTDDGLSWSTAINVSSGVNSGSHDQGVNISTGPNGEVYVLWTIYDSWPSDETALGFAISNDGGVSFQPASRIISNIRGIRSTETSKNHRVNSFPSMTVDISGGPRNGYIYVVWANVGVPGTNAGPDIDVYMIRSTDGAVTWSSPIRVNQDPIGQGKEHYFPWVTCDPSTGDVSVIYYDDRNVSSTQCETFVSYTFDGGDNWTDMKVSDVSFTPTPIPGLASSYMGDYLGITSSEGWVYPCWPDNRTGSIMTYVSPFELSQLPHAEFAADNTSPCLNDTVLFTDNTSRDPIQWEWFITPGTISYLNGTGPTSQNPEVRFESYGNYRVELIAHNTLGSDTLIREDYIKVSETNADFYAEQTTIVINNSTTFHDNSSCYISSYLWDFGSGATPATAITAGPHVVTYSTIGEKTVELTLNGSVNKTKTNYIEVTPEIFNMSNTAVTTCSGTFYDSGGDAASYANNEDFVMTFYPTDTSKSIEVEFTMFDIENETSCGYDYLRIYDGENTSANLLGEYCGTNSPDTVAAFNALGALTFQFHSDASVIGPGWAGNLNCVDPSPVPPPSYCDASASTCDEFIERVEIESIDNTTGCGLSGGYSDYTSLSTDVELGMSYNITITNGDLSLSSDQCGIWIDWNHDFDFNDQGETITVSGTPGTGPYTASISVPADATIGNARLRTRIAYTGDVLACGIASYGEVEDYILKVIKPGYWLGGASGDDNNWDNPGNWSDGLIPGPSVDVIVPGDTPYSPVINSSATCNNLLIEDNAVLTLDSGSSLVISGDLVVGEGISGQFLMNSGSCTVSGDVVAEQGSAIDITGGSFIENTQ